MKFVVICANELDMHKKHIMTKIDFNIFAFIMSNLIIIRQPYNLYTKTDFSKLVSTRNRL